jgi:hypothetical protein
VVVEVIDMIRGGAVDPMRHVQALLTALGNSDARIEGVWLGLGLGVPLFSFAYMPFGGVV